MALPGTLPWNYELLPAEFEDGFRVVTSPQRTPKGETADMSYEDFPTE